jgi:integrase
MASVKQVDGLWCVRWRDGGRGGRAHQRSFTTERLAQAFAQEVEDAIERNGQYEPRRVGRATPLAVILAGYIADSARRHAPRTTHNYAQHLDLFSNWAGPIGVDALSHQLLSDYHLHLANPKTGRHLHRRGANTIVKHFQAIEQAWAWAWKRQARGDYHGVPQPDSLELKRAPAPHKLAPTWAQMDATIAAADGWQRDLYVVLRCTGLRVQQALGLRWEDLRLDLEAPMLHLRPELGKSAQEKRGRWVPIAPVLVAELAGWGRREGDLLRCDRTVREARARDAQRAWKRAGVDPAVWDGCAHHAFRAGFESGLKRLGADTEAVEFLVGHSRGIRERYVGPDALPLVEAVRLVPAIGRDNVEQLRAAREG